MKTKTSLRSFLALSGSAMLVVSSVNATQYWDGGGVDANWNTAENWGGDTLPVFTDGNTTASSNIFFGGTNATGTGVGTVEALQTTANKNLTAGSIVEAIVLSNNGTTCRTQGFTLQGNSIQLGNGRTNEGISSTSLAGNAIVSSIENIINFDISLGTSGGTQNRLMSAGLNNNITVNGIISGSSNFVLLQQGAGTVRLTNANNSYAGPTNIANGGVLEISSIGNGGANSSIGASTNAAANLRFNSGFNNTALTTLRYVGSANASTDRAFSLYGNTGVNATNTAIESSGVGTLSFTNSAAITFSNPGVARNLYLSGTNTGDNNFNLAVGNNGAGVTSLTKQGDGKWIITGTNNTYTGATLVSAGTLLVNGSLGASAVTVDGGAFGGIGTIGSTLDLVSGSFYVADLSAALQVTGTVTLYAGFGIDDLAGLTWGSVANDTYTLIDGTLGAGVFDGLANNSLATAFDIGGGRSAYFQAGSLNLVVVPEPSSVALIGLVGLAFIARRRRN